MRKNYSAEEKQEVIDKYHSNVTIAKIAKGTDMIYHRIKDYHYQDIEKAAETA